VVKLESLNDSFDGKERNEQERFERLYFVVKHCTVCAMVRIIKRMGVFCYHPCWRCLVLCLKEIHLTVDTQYILC